MFLDLEKLAALFSYSRSVENIVYFYFMRDLDIGMHYLPSRIQHALLEIQMFEQNKVWSTIFSVKNIVHFYFLNLQENAGRSKYGKILPR